MFEKITPEEAGISSDSILRFISLLEKRGAIMHSFLLMKGDKLLTEHYWKPFDENFLHRMYSQTKSYSAIAIGLLEEEGKLSLDDKLVDIFPEKIDNGYDELLGAQTVREMLTMTTVGNPRNWFAAKVYDRTHHYLNRSSNHPSGTVWEYDSAGSQVLAAIAEKLSGMPLMDYLRSKLFNKMGTFKTAYMLKTPNGDSWGDSALLCTSRDMASFGRLLMNGGRWEGEQLINEKFVADATAKQVDNTQKWFNTCFYHGYGYQIWRTEQNGFAFVGMGDQLTICLSDKDLLFVCTADHQGTDNVMRNYLVNIFFDVIVDGMKDETLPKDEAAEKRLADSTSNLTLRAASGAPDSDFRLELSGRKYVCQENPMGITEFTFVFNGKEDGELHYTNEQGEKVIPFGVNHNVFGKFPQFGYSDGFGGTVTTDGFMYKDAASVAWLDEKKLILVVQIIDRYFGIMSATFAFKGEYAAAQFDKVGENFLDEYKGELTAKRV